MRNWRDVGMKQLDLLYLSLEWSAVSKVQNSDYDQILGDG